MKFTFVEDYSKAYVPPKSQLSPILATEAIYEYCQEFVLAFYMEENLSKGAEP